MRLTRWDRSKEGRNSLLERSTAEGWLADCTLVTCHLDSSTLGNSDSGHFKLLYMAIPVIQEDGTLVLSLRQCDIFHLWFRQTVHWPLVTWTVLDLALAIQEKSALAT